MSSYRFTAHYRSTPSNTYTTFDLEGTTVRVANILAVKTAKRELDNRADLTELFTVYRFDPRGTFLIPDQVNGGRKLAVEVKV